jgi:uncharacterized protein YxjI
MYVIRARFLSIGDDFDITDDDGRVVYHVDGKVFTMRNRMVIEDPDGREVAAVERHLVALRPTYAVTIGGEKAADVRKHVFTPFRNRFTIDIPGPGDLEVTGDLLDHEFTIDATASRWPRCRSGGSACGTPTASRSPRARTTCSCSRPCSLSTLPWPASGPERLRPSGHPRGSRRQRSARG